MRRSVVLPDPKNPVTIVIGIGDITARQVVLVVDCDVVTVVGG